MAPPTVAIAGGTGHLGLHITTALHEQRLLGHIADLIVLARTGSTPSDPIKAWIEAGTITIRNYDPTAEVAELATTLSHVDVFINAIGSAGYAFRNRLLGAVAKSDIKLYFPSEFGVDHTVHDFSHPEWEHKKEHMALAEKLLDPTRVRICRVFAGLFLEDSIGPWFGFDTKMGVYECFGSMDVPVTFTSLGDVGRAVAQLVAMGEGGVGVRERVHLSGDTLSVKEIAVVMGRESGEVIEVKERDLAEGREGELKMQRKDPSGCLRFLMGEGRINHSLGAMGCDNEIVNPGQGRWKWSTMADEARATKGRPWAAGD